MSAPEPTPIDLNAIRERFAQAGGQQYWRSLEELADTPAFREMVEREFPAGATEWWDSISRRDFLKTAAASLALAGLTGCTKQPTQKILPYVYQPEQLVPGQPLVYATAMVQGGFATGVLVKSREGHPIKVEGNPKHPASLGRSSVWMQASILDLYDPDRSQAVAHQGEISTWALFLADLNQLIAEQQKSKGAGLRILTETVTSPTLAALISQVLQRFPEARWHQFEPVNRDSSREGARLAFGEILETHYRFDQADVIVSLESDFLYAHPERLRYTRQFTDGRRLSSGRGRMNRLYVFESTPTITGSMSDQRIPARSTDIAHIAHRLASAFGPDRSSRRDENAGGGLERVIADLEAHRGSSIVIAGECQPAAVHALAHLLNERLGNTGKTVFYSDPAEPAPVDQVQSLRELLNDSDAGRVQTLLILGGNPAFNAPADLDFLARLQRIPRTVHLATHLDETSIRCTWHVPQAHYLESWGDARSFDGTVSLMQPLIAPLYGGKSSAEILGALLAQQPIRSDYDLLREYWMGQGLWPDFETGWRRALHDGIIADSAAPRKTPQLKVSPEQIQLPPAPNGALELAFRPDPNLWDGSFANNGWLQECPKPLSKMVWDNAALISPSLATKLGVATGEMLELRFGNRILECPAWIMPGQATDTVTLHLGYGRTRAGRVGSRVGFNSYELRTSKALWSGTGLELKKTGRRHALVATQTHHTLHSAERQVYRAATLQDFLARPAVVKESVEHPKPEHTLYNTDEYPYHGYKWGMSIDLSTCVGCNACLVACEVENNIPVVGKREVARNREMFWIRVDTYYEGTLDNPTFNHMPVPCMHCEHAPCELVCPVAATVHDHEGLNLQVYNRCVGTRFCSNNCPYKVRRFNFFQYAKYSAPSLKPMYNPDVTVRWRGVMEKCTYCVQRISASRILAEEGNRRIADGQVQTACQQACPADAIVFGDLNDPDSRVSRLKKHPLDYLMLGELNTLPRTTYLAKVHNPPTSSNPPPPA